MHCIAIAQRGWIGFQDGQEPVHCAWLKGTQGGDTLKVALNTDIDERGCLLHKVAHVTRQQLAVRLLLHAGFQAWQLTAHSPSIAKQRTLACLQRLYLLLGQLASMRRCTSV